VSDTRMAPLATPDEMEHLYAHIADVLETVDFRDRTQTGTHLMQRIRRVVQRAELDQNELNILRGFLTAVQNKRRTAGSGQRPADAANKTTAVPPKGS